MANTADEVWQLLGELAESQRTTERVLRETERFIQAVAQENRDRGQQVNEQIQQVNKRISDLGGAWGRFVEDLVAPACERLFVERGIPVQQVSQRVRRRLNGETMEIDVLVVNNGHVMAVEAKSSLSVTDVQDFIADLARFKAFFPDYADSQLYGAVAGIGIESGADRYAYRQGLFVLTQAGESAASTTT